MEYPLHLSFKVVAIAPQVRVTDATDRLILYVKQKAFKLKEAVTVFADAEQTLPIYQIRADRVIDFRATYHFEDAEGQALGGVRREGVRSIWRSRYEVLDTGGGATAHVAEDNPWTKVIDSVVGDVPILGALTGYLFHPSYTLARPDGTDLLRITKQPAFWEGKFLIEKLAPMEQHEAERNLLALLMLVLLERQRG